MLKNNHMKYNEKMPILAKIALITIILVKMWSHIYLK